MKLKTRDALQQELELKEHFIKWPSTVSEFFSGHIKYLTLNLKK